MPLLLLFRIVYNLVLESLLSSVVLFQVFLADFTTGEKLSHQALNVTLVALDHLQRLLVAYSRYTRVVITA